MRSSREIETWAHGKGRKYIQRVYNLLEAQGFREKGIIRPDYSLPQTAHAQRLSWALRLAAEANGLDEGEPITESREMAENLALMLWQSGTYVWSTEMYEAARTSSPLPPHRIMPHLPLNPMIWIFENDIGALSHPTTRIVATLIVSDGEYLQQYNLLADDKEDDYAEWTLNLEVPIGVNFPQDLSEKKAEAYGTLGKLLAFLESSYIPQEVQSGNRTWRRDAKKSGDHQSAQEVTYVTLRKIGGQKSGPSGRKLKRDIRWLVSGHFRNQWYASTGEHRLIWIAPYVKGPEQAPFKPPSFQVAR